MAEDTKPAASGSDADALVGKHLSDFLKSSFVYPDNNTRVVEPREALVLAAKGYPSGIKIAVESEAVVLHGTSIPYASPNLVWLKSAFERSVLGGITIAPDVPRESLIAFALRLRENFLRNQKSPSFAAFWSKPIPGIELSERRFTGVFGSRSEDAARREAQAEGMFADGAQGRVLLELLESTAGVQAAIEKITDALRSHEAVGSETRTMRLLETVVRQMPVETLVDPKRAVSTVEQVLAAAARRLADGGSSLTNDEQMIRSLVEDVGRKVFGGTFVSTSQAAKSEERKEGGLRGRAGDDEISEDENAFLRELHELPEMPLDVEVDATVGLRAEQMEILLYLIGEAPDAAVLARLRTMLAQQITELDEETLAILRIHLEPCFLKFASAEGKKQATRLLEILRESGRTDLLLRCGALSLEQIEANFPTSFVLFLDSLPSAPEEAAKLLGDACTAIGTARIQTAQNVLLSSGLTDKDRIERLLAFPHPPLLPLIQIMVRRADAHLHERLVNYVRRIHPELREAAALYAVEAPEAITPSYLEALIQSVVTGRVTAGLSDQTRDMLCSFVRSAAPNPSLQERRIYAIRRLRDFPDAKSLAVLHELLAGRGIFGLQGEPKPVRLAAKETLALMAGALMGGKS